MRRLALGVGALGVGALGVCVLGIGAGCQRSSEAEVAEREAVRAAAPLAARASTGVSAWLVRTIGGGQVRVEGMAPAGSALARWQPDGAAVAQLQAADLLVLNGAGLEAFTATVSLPASRVLDLSAPFRARWLYLPATLRHSHGPGGEHTHQGADPYLWLDPDVLASQARAIHGALRRRRPEHGIHFDGRLAEVLNQVDAWRGELQRATEALAGRGLLSDHPGYGYLARSQGWALREVGSAADGVAMHNALVEGPAPVLLTAAPLAEAIVARLKADFGVVVVVWPLGEGEDRIASSPLAAWRAATAALIEALSPAAGAEPAR